ncbi:MAG TPA: TadE family protein [Acidimicrobiales bacterium]
MGRTHRIGRNQTGSTIVEMAIVLPLFAALVLGIFSGGAAYAQKISVVDAAREGARYGASMRSDAAAGGLSTWRQNVIDRIVQVSGGQVAAADVCVDLVTPTGSNMTCGVPDPPGASSDPTVLAPARLVKVRVTRATKIEFVVHTLHPTITSKVVARYERDVV